MKYQLPKKPTSPAHFFLELSDEDGNRTIKRRLITYRNAKKQAAALVRSGTYSVLIIHGAADPNDPPAEAILASFCREPLQGHRQLTNSIALLPAPYGDASSGVE